MVFILQPRNVCGPCALNPIMHRRGLGTGINTNNGLGNTWTQRRLTSEVQTRKLTWFVFLWILWEKSPDPWQQVPAVMEHSLYMLRLSQDSNCWKSEKRREDDRRSTVMRDKVADGCSFNATGLTLVVSTIFHCQSNITGWICQQSFYISRMLYSSTIFIFLCFGEVTTCVGLGLK